MGDKKEVLSETIKYSGMFNYSDMYSFFYNWLKDEGFKISEDEYSEKVGAAKDIDIVWKSKKGITDYYVWHLNITWKIIGMGDTEAEVDGKKVKMNKANLKLKVVAELESDPDKNWDKNPTHRFLRGVYDKYIIKATTDEYGGKLRGKAESLVEEMKSYLNLSGKK